MKALLPPLLYPQAPFVSLYVRLHPPCGVVEFGYLGATEPEKAAYQVVLVGFALLIYPAPHYRLAPAGVTMGGSGNAQLLALCWSLLPAILCYARGQLFGPLSPVAFGDELVAAPHQPVEVGIGAKTPVSAHQGSPALLALFCQAQ